MTLTMLVGFGVIIAIAAGIWWVRWFRRWRESEDRTQLAKLVRGQELLRSLYRSTFDDRGHVRPVATDNDGQLVGQHETRKKS